MNGRIPSFSEVMSKHSAALLTPQAESAAVAPPMPPPAPAMDPAAAMGGMPPQGAPPMDPAAMGGMPPAMPAPMPADPAAMAPAAAPAAGGDPSQDPMFMQFLQEVVGITMPQPGQFVDPNGAPVPPDMIAQIYAQFQQEMAAQQGGAAPAGQQGAPVDPAAMGADPAAAMGDPEQNPMINAIASLVMDAVEAVLKDQLAGVDKKISAIMDKIDSLKMTVDEALNTTDTRTPGTEDDDAALNAALDAELKNPTAVSQAPTLIPTAELMGGIEQPAAVPGKQASVLSTVSKHINIVNILRGGKPK